MRRHVPILLEEVLELVPEGAKTYLDGTFGHGGHTQELLKKYEGMIVVGVDKDEKMIEKAKVFMEGGHSRCKIVQGSYAELPRICEEAGVKGFDCILLDIGVNMDHFKEADRGFSIKLDGDLDMRFDTSKGMPVKEWLRKTHFEELDTIFTQYTDFGQRYRENLVRDLIVQKRKNPFDTTGDVKVRAKTAGVNAKVLAIIFQAWRIYINNELGELVDFLANFTKFLLPGGRCCVITYHSGEDRLVKGSFKELVDNKQGILYNKKVIKPNRKEMERNKASRSAKLRIFEKNR